tara:strand:- start:20594 stop:20890 length:297 start_codon:yes stop_codon:yes gene_type:complete
MKTGKSVTFTALSRPLRVPVLNLPLVSSLIVILSSFLFFMIGYFVLGVIAGFIFSIVFSFLIWRHFRKTYLYDKDYYKIMLQNSKRQHPNKKDRYYVS